MGLSTKKIDLLRAFVDFTCEECHRTELELSQKGAQVVKLQPHRIKQGGDYSLRNIKMCCEKCHGRFSAAQRIANGTQNK